MKTKTKIAWSAVFVIVVIAIIVMTLPMHNAEAPIASNVPVMTHGYDVLPYTFKKDDVETDTTSIHITQPVISGLPSTLIDGAVNSQLDTAFADVKKSFLADTAGVEIFSKDMKHQLTVNGGAPLVSSSKVFYVDTEIYSYLSGSAHPLTVREVFNFVRESGQLIRLQDILKRDTPEPSDSNALATDADYKTALAGISNLAKPKILDQLRKVAQATGASAGVSGDGTDADNSAGGAEAGNGAASGTGNQSAQDVSRIFEPSGAAPTLDNYGVFYVHADRIEWVFGQYQVAPYVFGEIKISIPMSQLAPYLAPRSYLK